MYSHAGARIPTHHFLPVISTYHKVQDLIVAQIYLKNIIEAIPALHPALVLLILKVKPSSLRSQGIQCFLLKLVGTPHIFNLFHYEMSYIAGKISAIGNGYEDDEKPSQHDGQTSKHQADGEALHAPSHKNCIDSREKQAPALARVEDDDIFVRDGIDYAVPGKEVNDSPVS